MGHEELIKCFNDTLSIIESDSELAVATERAKATSIVYKENFTHANAVQSTGVECAVEVIENTTFAEAYTHVGTGKIAVLNFANPVTPGGGVTNGAKAQEECLCRCSNLYPCLISESVKADYYDYNRSLNSFFYSDRLIYAKDITVIKFDDFTMPGTYEDNVPEAMNKTDWFQVDVITCAAPYIAKRRYTNHRALNELFKRRIKNIFESAIENNVDILILGAFGCGAFKNPPFVVAAAFKEVIDENNYRSYFKKIIFAIKRTEKTPCPNLMAFQREITGLSEEMNLLRFTDGFALGQAVGEIIMPSGKVLHGGEQFNPYIKWKQNNKYSGKQFSILGDSLSTLEGYNPRGYNVFYKGADCEKSGVNDMKDTWWGKLIDFFDGHLLVNNSWSGSRATGLPNQNKLFPSGCSDERTNGLHIDNVKPDVIIIYLGTNDWANGIKLSFQGTVVLGEEHLDYGLFDYAYERMLEQIKSNYPTSELWCCTLNSTYMKSKPKFKFPESYGGTHIENYNQIIRSLSKKHGCQLIDLYNYHLPYDTVDGSHPTVAGMSTLATLMLRSVANDEGVSFLTCEENHHNFIVGEAFTGGTQYVCDKCGMINSTNLLYDDINSKIADNDSERVISLQPDMTTILYPDTISLYSESKQEIKKIQKKEFHAGRESNCDLRFTNKYIARIQATFSYQNSEWFIRDNDSTNGTWINDTKIEPRMKYRLYADDVIDFAHAEKVIFFKTERSQDNPGNDEKKAVVFLEAGIAVYAKSGDKDQVAFRLIVAGLSNASMLFPVEIDTEAMLGDIDPTTLKAGDVLKPSTDVKVKILTIKMEDGTEFVPMFTSSEAVQKGQSVSTVSYHPQDYLPMLAKMDKPVVINPFSDHKFLLTQELIQNVLLPIMENKSKPPESDTPDDKAGALIGGVIKEKYQIMKLLGKGGAFNVYLALDAEANKQWVIKVSDKNDKRITGAVKDAILQEPYMMMKFDHPAIPKVVDIIEDESHIFIVRDYIEGETPEESAKHHGAQPVDQVISLAKELCGVLGYLHELNPPHIFRDMKPSNIMLLPNGRIKLIDFGITRLYDPKKPGDTCCLGTRGYAAPEQYYSGRQSDARTDIFGLGMTLYYLVTGVDPKSFSFEYKPIREMNPSLPIVLERIINKCVELDPKKRYQSCAELLDALNNETPTPKSKNILGKLFGK